jgi:hypothetical protein
MKFIAAAIIFISLSAAANEVECVADSVNFVVRGPAPENGNYKEAELRFSENGKPRRENYLVTTTTGLQRVEYQARGLKLSVDIWPDSEPEWGTVYPGLLLSSAIRNAPAILVDCRYP